MPKRGRATCTGPRPDKHQRSICPLLLSLSDFNFQVHSLQVVTLRTCWCPSRHPSSLVWDTLSNFLEAGSRCHLFCHPGSWGSNTVTSIKILQAAEILAWGLTDSSTVPNSQNFLGSPAQPSQGVQPSPSPPAVSSG